MTGRRPKEPFELRRALERAEQILSAPPARPHIERPEPRGELVARFALPLELVRPQNRTRHAPPGVMAGMKQRVHRLLALQAGTICRDPLPGRPQVLCVRFSSVEPDKYNDSFKAVVDALCVPAGRRKKGLGFLRDDKPSAVDLHQWWEPAPQGAGFAYIEIRTGNGGTNANGS